MMGFVSTEFINPCYNIVSIFWVELKFNHISSKLNNKSHSGHRFSNENLHTIYPSKPSFLRKNIRLSKYEPKFLLFRFRARQSGTRINIQTQTTSLLKKPSPLPKSAPAATTVVSNGSDDYDDDDAAADVADSRAAVHAEQEDAAGDWRLQSHSLPSLGRASSGNGTKRHTFHLTDGWIP